MKQSIVKKGVVVGVMLLFVGMTFTVMSSTIETPGESPSRMTSPADGEGNVLYDEGYPPRYVMSYIEFPPENESSPKPEVLRDLPSSFSWLNHAGQDWTTMAQNQGWCGSCWDFAAVGCLESVINIAWGIPTLDVDLSEQYVLSCLPISGSCAGGNSYAAFRYIKYEGQSGDYVNGIITEACLPYYADDEVPCSEKCPEWRSTLIPISSYGFWNPDYPDDVSAMKSQLVNEGPVVTYFYATSDFSHWGNTHHDPDDYYPYVESGSSNHAEVIVGYKDDVSIPNGGYWIVKNSWGTGWGYNGFFNIEYGSLNIDNVQITWVQYNATPIASFTSSPTNPAVSEMIQFTDTSTDLIGEVISWSWDFGDNTTSDEQNPTHSYAVLGTYPVMLTVTDDTGHVGVVIQDVYVGDDLPPITNCTITGKLGENGWYTTTMVVRLKGVDAFSGNDYTMYNLDGQGYQLYERSLIFYPKNSEGTHTLSYYSVDRAGNVEEEKTIEFNIDASKPTVAVTKPKDGYLYVLGVGLLRGFQQTIVLGPLKAVCTVNDSGSGVNKTEFYFDEEFLGVDTEPPFTCLINGRSNGTVCDLQIVAYDKAGRSTIETVHFMFYCLGLLKD
jgi:hypothetical protein